MKGFLDEKQVIKEIVLAVLVPAGMGDNVHKNRPSHGIALNTKGEKRYIFSNGKVLTVRENDLIYLPKNSSYTVETFEIGDVYCINFQCEVNETFEPLVINVPVITEIVNAYQNAERTWRSMTDNREYKVMSELYKILYEIKRVYSSPYLPKTKQDLISPAIEYIHKHYTDGVIDVKWLSELCGISYDYFRKLFLKFFGVSPINYINDLKLNRAKELLSSGISSVSESAYNSGFSDLSHFSRFFKQKVGVLPSEYNGSCNEIKKL